MSTATKVYLDILEHCQQWQKKITEMETKSDVLLFKKLKHLKTDVDQIVLKQSLDTPRPSVSYTNKELSDTDIDTLFGELTFQTEENTRDAKIAICKHTGESKRYKTATGKAKEELDTFLKDIEELQTEKIELQSMLQKQIFLIKMKNKTEQDDIKREGKSNLKLKNENNSLRDEVIEMANKRKRSSKQKVDKFQRDLKDAKDRLKDQEAISNKQMAVYEANIRDLRKQLSETESTRWENASSRRTNVCPTCEAKKQHMNRYKRQKETCYEKTRTDWKNILHTGGNDLTRQLQKTQMENNEYIELVKSLKTQIRDTEPDETSCLTTKSLEITIKNQKKLILEIQKRLIQLQNALNEAEQATKETKMMLNNCREDKIAVKALY
ncbi:unnamed protein product [Mytilus edulis]|uniref:Uncharacterized protein n=1 Tax=Mytilus edulis TaxID=6550 RepID=A0A8S3SL23_MYTED|nr:unnamed protein product [Mytilus edulis]